jgi:hypothetical protein
MTKHIFTKNVPSGTPANTLRPGTSDFMYSPEVSGEARASLFALIPLTPEEVFADPEFKSYFARISSPAAGQFRFDRLDFQTNGTIWPTRAADALRLGVAMYDPEEDATVPFMKSRIREVISRGAQVEAAVHEAEKRAQGGFFSFAKKRTATSTAEVEATTFMAKEHRVLCNFRKLALQEGGIPSANLPKGQTLLVFSSRDPRNPNPKDSTWAMRHNPD